MGLILIANVPTAVIGLFFKKFLGWTLTNPLVVALCFIVTAVFYCFLKKRLLTGLEIKWVYWMAFSVSC